MESLQYLAGFFDGEGSVGVYRTSGKKYIAYSLKTQVTQNKTDASEQLFQDLKRKYGGAVSCDISSSGKTTFNWQLTGPNAATFLTDIEPYLILKRQQAQIAIEYQKRKPSRQRNKRGQLVKMDTSFLEYSKKISEQLMSMKP